MGVIIELGLCSVIQNQPELFSVCIVRHAYKTNKREYKKDFHFLGWSQTTQKGYNNFKIRRKPSILSSGTPSKDNAVTSLTSLCIPGKYTPKASFFSLHGSYFRCRSDGWEQKWKNQGVPVRNKRKRNLRFAILLSQSLSDEIVSSFYSGLLRRYVDIREMQAKSKKGSSREETSNGRRKLLWGGWKAHRHFLYTYWRPKKKKKKKGWNL